MSLTPLGFFSWTDQSGVKEFVPLQHIVSVRLADNGDLTITTTNCLVHTIPNANPNLLDRLLDSIFATHWKR